MRNIVAIGLSPNTKNEDVAYSLRLLLSPWKWIRGNAVHMLEAWFGNYFQRNAVAFINARSALYEILTNLEIGQGDEVILQAFTCVVVPNSVIATGARPVYVDINSDLALDASSVSKSITKKTKAIIVQHTFGIPAEMESLVQLCKKNKIYLIEDVAHSIGGEYKGQKLGTFGVASIFSFGRDKAFSSVFGGMAITSDKSLYARLRNTQNEIRYPSPGWVSQQLMYPIICWLILSFYNTLSVGKILHFILSKIKFFSFPVSKQERNGVFSKDDIKKFPNSLALLALKQVGRINEYNNKRMEISSYYENICKSLNIDFVNKKRIPLMRFPIFVKDKQDIKQYFAKRLIYIGDWYMQAVDPVNTKLNNVFYEKGMCPNAEEIAKKIINLPTYPTMTAGDKEKVAAALKKYYSKKN